MRLLRISLGGRTFIGLQVLKSQFELLDLTHDPAGTIGSYVYSDSVKKYRTPPTERLSLNLNVNNVFHTGNMESDIENEVLRLHTLNVSQPRIVQIGLRYQWGGVTGDERLRNGGRGMYRGGPGGRGDGGPGFGNGGGGGGFGPGPGGGGF